MSHRISELDPEDIRVFSGTSNPELAEKIADYLGVPLLPTLVRRFSNDNMYVQLGESVRGRVVVIVQSFSPPVNDHIMELFMMCDAARGAGAREIHAVIPYYSFARSDKKDAPRISITGRLIARLIGEAGATHVVTMTLHSPQVHGFFDMPTDHLTSRPVVVDYLRQLNLEGTIVVSPDAGHAMAATRLAEHLNLPMAAGSKERLSDSSVKITGLIGNVKGYRRAIIVDDEIAAASSVIGIGKLLVKNGIEELIAVCTHGVFCGNAFERLAAVPQFTEIVTTDTVPIPEARRPETLRVLSVAPLFGEAIKNNYLSRGIGDLFAFWQDFKKSEEG
ncbi:MAG: ribose-phosphate diphosphokinase [Chloroflexota bacterium]